MQELRSGANIGTGAQQIADRLQAVHGCSGNGAGCHRLLVILNAIVGRQAQLRHDGGQQSQEAALHLLRLEASAPGASKDTSS